VLTNWFDLKHGGTVLVNNKDSYGMTPLHYVAMRCKHGAKVRTVKGGESLYCLCPRRQSIYSLLIKTSCHRSLAFWPTLVQTSSRVTITSKYLSITRQCEYWMIYTCKWHGCTIYRYYFMESARVRFFFTTCEVS
jgi:hypothetical protein